MKSVKSICVWPPKRSFLGQMRELGIVKASAGAAAGNFCQRGRLERCAFVAP